MLGRCPEGEAAGVYDSPPRLTLSCRKCKSLILITHDDLVTMYRALDFDAPGGRPHR